MESTAGGWYDGGWYDGGMRSADKGASPSTEKDRGGGGAVGSGGGLPEVRPPGGRGGSVMDDTLGLGMARLNAENPMVLRAFLQ